MPISTEGIKVKVNGKEVGCLDSIGKISLSRDKKKKKCLTTGEIRYVLDTIETGDLDLGISYDPTDSAGAGELESVFNSGETCLFEIELPDTAGTNGTTFKWEKTVVPNYDINPDDDGEISVEIKVAPGGKPTVIPAA